MFFIDIMYNHCMPAPILATKLYIPPPRPGLVSRPHLVARLNEGLAAGRKLTLISAAAGFGKTTLLCEWISSPPRPVGEELGVKTCWLSLDPADSDPIRFLTYLVAALQTIQASLGENILSTLQSPQPPPIETLLTTLVNEIAAISEGFILVLDDYHAIEAEAVDQIVTLLLDHQPLQMHLVIASREYPQLALARLRTRGQLTELRAADLRFTPTEAAVFLNRVMALNLSDAEITALETRTEGWIAGLQLAALAMQGEKDSASFIQSFSGSHRFVLDYLIEEVLHHQPPHIQDFLLRTSILDRLYEPLCNAVMGDTFNFQPSTSILESLERANLFIIPLDNERRWYRYHHLFRDLLCQRLARHLQADEIDVLHIRASEWYENNALLFDAFRHAASANDVARAEHLIESGKMGLHLRSVATAILDWIASLPKAVLDARPGLWVRAATLSLVAGQTTGVEEKLQAAEKAFENVVLDDSVRDLMGQMACARATLALTRYEPEEIITQARRALEYLHPDNLTFRFTANWALASASLLQGDRLTAAQACREGVAISQKTGDMFSIILANSDWGTIQELENQLHQAAETYHRVIEFAGAHPQPNIGEVHLGLARIHYEWNDLEAAEMHANQSLHLMRQYDRMLDRFILSEVFLAQLKLKRGEVDAAADMLAQTEQAARQKNFTLRLPDVAAAQVLVLLKQGNAPAAAALARQFDLHLGHARALLAQGGPADALAILEPYRRQVEAKAWQDERLKTMVLQAVAQRLAGDKGPALATLAEALALAEPGGFIRLFMDEGDTMRLLIADFRFSIGKFPKNLLAYADTLLAAFSSPAQSEIRNQKSEILTSRELEILRLIADGLTNEQIANRLYLSLYTVKAHVRNIFAKLDAASRTQAVSRARELGLMH